LNLDSGDPQILAARSAHGTARPSPLAPECPCLYIHSTTVQPPDNCTPSHANSSASFLVSFQMTMAGCPQLFPPGLEFFSDVRWLAPTCSLLARARDKAAREPES
jgi:hypothetical protein